MLKKRFFIFVKLFVYFLLDSLASLLFFLRNEKTAKANEILIIASQQLGDFIIQLETLKKFKSEFKDAKIILLCADFLVDLAEKTKYFDSIITININKLFLGSSILKLDLRPINLIYRLQKLLELKRKKYKKIINPSNLFYVSILVNSLNSDEKIGVLDRNKYLGNLFNLPYTKLVKLESQSELINFAKFFRETTGNQHFLAGLPKFEFELPKYDGLQNTEIYCAVSLSGSFFEKNWGVENFTKTLESLDFKIDIVLVGTKNEMFFAKEFLKLYRGENKVLNLVGKTTLLEYISIIKYAKFAFGNDSSIIHIAVATGTPSVCILSGHSFGFCVPYLTEKSFTSEESKFLPIPIFHKMDCFGCGLICNLGLTKNKKFQCVENIKVSLAIEALNRLNS